MSSLFHSIFALLLGLALTLFGTAYGVTQYPGGSTFAQLIEAIPALVSVLLFTLCVISALAGIVMLVVSHKRLRQRWQYLREVTNPHRRHRAYHGNGDGMHEDERVEQEWGGAYR